jgi:hypothetical protein
MIKRIEKTLPRSIKPPIIPPPIIANGPIIPIKQATI